MQPTDYEFVARLFTEACDIDPDSRAAFLELRCKQRPDLRAEVEAMLREDTNQGIEAGGAGVLLNDAGQVGELPTIDDPSSRLPRPPDSPSQILGVFAGYELLEEIGRGGMGIVYRARQQQPNRIVALKMIRAGKLASELDVQRFYAEAQAAANVDHEGLVPIYEVGEYQGEHFFTMKFVEGHSLAQRLKFNDMPRRRAVEMLCAVCEAIAHVHQRGVVHRDLKPSNILLDDHDRPRVTDFGLAKSLHEGSSLTVAGDVMGTPGYMSPEQATGAADQVTPAADVYSLGAILYQILTGRTPLDTERANLAQLLLQIQQQEISSPRALNRWIPRDLDTICMKCLEKDPEARYPTAGELAADLRRYLHGEPILAKPLGVLRRLSRWGRRRPGLATTWTALLVFYIYHMLCRQLFGPEVITDTLHRVSTAVALTWFVGAWIFQRLLLRSSGRPIYLYGWVTLDVTLLTVLLFAADGAASPLLLLYPVLVAGAVLRFRTDLVSYVTGLCLMGYLTHVAYAKLYFPERLPTFLEAVPFVICLLIIGLVQHLALRRLRTSDEEPPA